MPDFNDDIAPARFIAFVLVMAIGVSLAFAGFIFLIDPYNIWRPGAIHRINETKLERPFPVQMDAAVWDSVLHKPEVLSLGSSRVRRGFSQAQASQLIGAKVMVTGIDLLPLRTAKDLFFSISKHTRLRRLYLEVNYLTSNDCVEPYPPIEADRFVSLRSVRLGEALVQSMKTLRINLFGPTAFDSFYDSQGRYRDDQEDAAHTRSAQRRRVYDRFFDNIESNCRRNPNQVADFKDLADIFNLAQSNHTEVVLLVLPTSAHWKDRIDLAGMAPTLAQWKANVTRTALHFHSRLLDYEQFDELSHRTASASEIPLFWDDTHFSHIVGNRLLAHMVTSDGALAPN